jgi:hypothetical protein
MKRKILVILKNRFTPTKPGKYIELDCKSDGTILKEQVLKRPPREAKYEEVWENHDGKTELASCMRMSKQYRHPLIKQKPPGGNR